MHNQPTNCEIPQTHGKNKKLDFKGNLFSAFLPVQSKKLVEEAALKKHFFLEIETFVLTVFGQISKKYDLGNADFQNISLNQGNLYFPQTHHDG